MVGSVAFVLFLLALAAVICVAILLQPDEYFRRKRVIVCPETHLPAEIELNLKTRIRSLLKGEEHLDLTGCTRWPGRAGCGEECLLQVDLNPKILERTLHKLYEEEACGLCGRVLSDDDWRWNRMAMLDRNGALVPGGKLALHQFPAARKAFRPVCWPCHSRLRAAHVVPETLFKGDRRGRLHEPLLQD